MEEKDGSMMKKKKSKEAIGIISFFAAALCLGLVIANSCIFEDGECRSELYASGEAAFYRREPYGKWDRGTLDAFPDIDKDGIGLDFRGYDISGLNLSGHEDDLRQVAFDTDTIWPDLLPDGFDPEKIMKTGMDPGLGIRELHKQGYTGEGVSIAIIDQGLGLDHVEYQARICGYELLHAADREATMHGAAVASLAVGKSCGVAPDADLYYISTTFADLTPFGFLVNLSYVAEGIDRILEINELLPEDKKIRVISISRGFDMRTRGASALLSSIHKAMEEGILVLTTSPERYYDYEISGIGRGFTSDPDDVSSYVPGLFLEDSFYNGYDKWYDPSPSRRLLIPMDNRTYASFTGTDGYEYCAHGGVSWTVPYLAGVYALCVQKSPAITPEEFMEKAMSTGTVQTIEHNGQNYILGTILDPVKLMGGL